VPRSAIRAFAGLSGPYDFFPFDVAASIDAFGEAPDPRATQPITFAGAGDPPSLLVTGDADQTVGVHNSENLAALLRRAGVPVELEIYPGLSHADTLLALSRPLRDDAPVLSDVAGFFRQYAGIGL
jgi:dipeptidyl aminopeptidase/acylaminoacyl peptidase